MLRARFEDPSVSVSLKGFTKTLQVSLTDLGEDYVFTLKDGELCGLEKKSVPDPDVTVIVAGPLMEGIMSKTSNGILAYLTGRLKMKGSMDDLLRLQKLIG